ncbi:MAG: hypothetical protein C4289_12205 [Chloroflexota bacterium]
MLALVACNRGLPAQPGQYAVHASSIAWDGEKYFFLWSDAQGNLHRASGDDIKLAQDERTYLEIREKPSFLGLGRSTEAILHLRNDQPVLLYGRDRDGDFTSFWFPFLLGHLTAGGGGPPPPRYHYPPRSSLDRGERLEGSLTSDRPQPPDYRRLAPAPGTVSGQAGGTGGGTAATAKGGFRAGKDSFDAQQRALAQGRSLGVGGSGSATGGSKVTPPGQAPAVRALSPRGGSGGAATVKGGGGRSFSGVRVRR